MAELPYVLLQDVWEIFGYRDFVATRQAFTRGTIPIPLYKIGANAYAMDRQAFNAFFLLRRHESLEAVLRDFEQVQASVKQLKKYRNEYLWFSARNLPGFIKKEFPDDLDPCQPQIWDPASEFPDELLPEPETEPEPEIPEIQLDGYYPK